jgi:hypothetical protein
LRRCAVIRPPVLRMRTPWMRPDLVGCFQDQYPEIVTAEKVYRPGRSRSSDRHDRARFEELRAGQRASVGLPREALGDEEKASGPKSRRTIANGGGGPAPKTTPMIKDKDDGGAIMPRARAAGD